MKNKINLRLLIILIIISAGLGIAFNSFYSKGISLIREEKKITWADSTLFKENQINSENLNNFPPQNENFFSAADEKKMNMPAFITLKQAFDLYKSKIGIFIDARDKWDFGEGHIEGAINIPYYNFEENNPVLKTISKKKTIVTYCDGDDCEASVKLADNLIKLGYSSVFVFFGGWDEWTKAGYNIEKKNL